MSLKPITPDANTIKAQRLASNPNHSAWVSANAGSGKTFVLSRRVVRLLLQGTDPSKILCLTYTKTAAGEMSNKVFEILGDWASLPEEKLRRELKEVQGKPPTSKQLKDARTLFARALETPGGLKIQTIHGFCESLLHQFPLEANVPGNFSIVDDATQKALIEHARKEVVLDADANPDSPMGKAFFRMMEWATDLEIEKVFKEIITNRDKLANWLEEVGGPEEAESIAKRHNEFLSDVTLERLHELVVEQSELQKIDLANLAQKCSEIDQTGAANITNQIQIFVESKNTEERINALRSMTLNKDGSLKKSYDKYPSDPISKAVPGIREVFEKEATRLVAARLRTNTFRLIENTTPLLIVAQAVMVEYRRIKRQRGLLDFDDLVTKTADLLTVKSARTWVLYKLDLGLDHILIDEAQDTSPRQWQVISALVDEFFDGESARQLNRTVFVVGDEKQSIYSFQGARPESFDKQKRAYTKQARQVEKPLENVNLNNSFRSTQDVLSAVDTVFAAGDNSDGLNFSNEEISHVAARKNILGSVDVWDMVEPEENASIPEWHIPQNQNDNTHQAILLARKMANVIHQWIGKERLESSGALISAGDILVLVRSRDRFMVALNRELKDRGISVAGADKLALTNHIAVQDLVALGQVMLTPEDDLSLAAILKSPLFGLDEDQLYELARARLKQGHEISLFEALAEFKDKASFSRAYELLIRWRGRADILPVYEFYARLLGADGGRKAFFTRLGNEAEDVLDAFLDLSLSHEQKGLPGLQAFLEALVRDAPEIKREMDQTAGQVRVMTVHAAKGLEAPIVFLVDKGGEAFQSRFAAALYHWRDGEEGAHNIEGFFWVPKAELHGDASLKLNDEEKRKAEQEYRRLLYVGMTRAEDRLIICGYCGKNGLKQPNWHTMVSSALSPNWEEASHGDGSPFHRWRAPLENRKANQEEEISKQEEKTEVSIQFTHQLPDWINHHLPKESALPRPLSPSGAQALIEESLLEEKMVPSLLEESAKQPHQNPRQRGTAIHRLLQVLPDMKDEERWGIAENYLKSTLPDYSIDAHNSLLKSIRTTLNSSNLAPYLNPANSRAEVSILGKIELASGPRPVSGTIDRLAVLDDEVMLIDYKTSARAPDHVSEVSPDYLTQMALYRALVTKLYPNKKVNTALVWTHAPGGPRFMLLSEAELNAALTKIAKL